MNTFWQVVTQLRQSLVWWVVVQPWEQALRVRLGRHVVRLGPGIHFKVPFADAVYRQSVRMRWCDLPVQTITTADGRAVTLAINLGYQVEDIERLYQTLHHAEGTLRNMAMSAVAEAVHRMAAEACTPASVEKEATAALDLAPYGIGATVVRITDFAFVRTYRLIQDQKWGTHGDELDTSNPLNSPVSG